MSLHIAVNARLLLRGRLEGIGRFAHEVLQRLVAAHPEVRFSFLFDRPFAPEFRYLPRVKCYTLTPPARHPWLYVAYYEYTMKYFLQYLKPDLYFSPDGYLCLGSAVPQVPVFHDLAYVHHPETIDRWHRWHYGRYFPRYARKAAHILTVSDYSRADIARTWQLDPAGIRAVYCGVSAHFQPAEPVLQQATRFRYADGAPYFLYVGTLQPRKNLSRLLRAFDAFLAAEPARPHRLLLVGRRGWMNDELEQTYAQMQHRDRVRFIGMIDDTVLAALYRAALALVYVSLYEGFGLPILEAQACGTPAIVADRSSLPEVAGGGALVVPAESPEAIAHAMATLAHDETLRAALAEAGRHNLERYSWDRTTLHVWEGLLQGLAHKPTA